MKKRKIIYGLLLSGAIFLLCAAIAPGDAYARYNTCAGWNTVINASGNALPVLTENTKTLTLPFAETTENAVCSIQRMQGDGTFANYEDAGLTASLAGEGVQIHMGDGLPPAGTYRVVVTWASEDAESVSTETATFFVNYSDR